MANVKHDANPKAESAQKRRERLAAELRSNLTKRKAQVRARARPENATDDAAPEPTGSDETNR